ncbi:MAG: hypothetical protein ACOCYO_10145 [Bacteroidota bacterium]
MDVVPAINYGIAQERSFGINSYTPEKPVVACSLFGNTGRAGF